MPKRDADLLIEDIETAVARIESYIAGLDREGFLEDQKTIDGIARRGLPPAWATTSLPSKKLDDAARVGREFSFLLPFDQFNEDEAP